MLRAVMIRLAPLGSALAAAATAFILWSAPVAAHGRHHDVAAGDGDGDAADLAPTEEPAAESPARRRRPGTFFIGELGGGATLSGAGSMSFGGVLGVGGKLRGVPPRFYLIAGARHTQTSVGGYTLDGSYVSDDLGTTDLGLGLRIYFPVFGPLRLLTEGFFGTTVLEARANWAGGSDIERASLGFAEFSVGPQVRLTHHLSVGARAAWTFVDTGSLQASGPLVRWERDASRRTTVLGTITAHF